MAGVVLGRLQTSARNAGSVDVFGRISQAIEGPPSSVFATTADGITEFLTGVANARSLVVENRALKSQMAAVALYTETMDRLSQEIESLRRLQGFPPIAGKIKVPAEVIGYYPYENRLTLSAGSDRGVRVGQPVVAPEGLIGRIQVVTPKSSQVLLLSSPEASNRIGALAMRNPPSAGLLRGESSTTYLLEFNDPKAPVANGDLVVTSGFSEHIPRGIPIGRVIQVDDNVEFGKRQARVYPNVAIGTLREVFILK